MPDRPEPGCPEPSCPEPDRPEDMAGFFDRRADGYEEHMRGAVVRFAEFYGAVAGAVAATGEPVKILDLGCGTGLELEGILRRAPNARITAVDLSAGMLAKLRDKLAHLGERLTTIQDSYVTLPLPETCFDYVVSVQTMHHLLPDPKRDVYRKIRRSLKPGGLYIEGDYVVSPADERRFLAEYVDKIRNLDGSDLGQFHVDIPFSLETQRRLLKEAGFAGVELVFQAENNAVLVATAGGTTVLRGVGCTRSGTGRRNHPVPGTSQPTSRKSR